MTTCEQHFKKNGVCHDCGIGRVSFLANGCPKPGPLSSLARLAALVNEHHEKYDPNVKQFPNVLIVCYGVADLVGSATITEYPTTVEQP